MEEDRPGATVTRLHPLPHGPQLYYDELRRRISMTTARGKAAICRGAKTMLGALLADAPQLVPEEQVCAALVALRTAIHYHFSDDAGEAMRNLCADLLRGADPIVVPPEDTPRAA